MRITRNAQRHARHNWRCPARVTVAKNDIMVVNNDVMLGKRGPWVIVPLLGSVAFLTHLPSPIVTGHIPCLLQILIGQPLTPWLSQHMFFEIPERTCVTSPYLSYLVGSIGLTLQYVALLIP